MKIDDVHGYKVVRDDNPAVPQKYNQLAAFEMSSEANCNQIDGIVNNEHKPSILEQLRQNMPNLPERGGKPGRAVKPER